MHYFKFSFHFYIQPARIPAPAKKEKKGGGKKKRGGGGRAKSRSPPPFKMEFIDSVVVEKFDEPTEEEFERMLQEEVNNTYSFHIQIHINNPRDTHSKL